MHLQEFLYTLMHSLGFLGHTSCWVRNKAVQDRAVTSYSTQGSRKFITSFLYIVPVHNKRFYLDTGLPVSKILQFLLLQAKFRPVT